MTTNLPGAHIEREYKFTTDLPPAELEALLQEGGYKFGDSLQVYVDPLHRVSRRAPGEPGVHTRYKRTRKTLPTLEEGVASVREEQEGWITAEEFAPYAIQALLGELPYLVKRRYDVPLDGVGVVAEVDIYRFPTDGPVVIEVELRPEFELPSLPEWFGTLRPVDHDPLYYAANIAEFAL